MASTKKRYVSNKHILLAVCGSVLLSYLAIFMAYRNTIQEHPASRDVASKHGIEGPKKDGATVKRANNPMQQTSTANKGVERASNPVQQHQLSKEHSEYTLVPKQCNSQMRGLEFDMIYSNGKWFNGKGLRHPDDFYGDANWPPNESRRKSASGTGSDLGHETVTSLKVLKDVIETYDVKSMIDIPCGDVNWIFDSYATDALPLYVGLDISFAVINVNRMRFDHHRNKQFHFWDATDCAMPKYQETGGGADEGDARPFDLVHVRDVIQHMTLDQGVRFFCNVFRANPRVLITTTFPNVRNNRETKEGGFYENNLMLKPFFFPEGDLCTPTHPDHEKDVTCVYNLTKGNWVEEFTSKKC